MIKAIIFDLGGVIMRCRDVSEPVRRFIELGVKNAEELMGLYGQQGIFLALENGSITEKEFLKELSVMAGRVVSYEEAKYAWLGFVRDVPDSNIENLKQLRSRYKLYLLSNTNGFIQDWARSNEFCTEHQPIQHYFDRLFCSHEMKDYKPAPSIFRKLLEETGLLPEECLFLDDAQKNVDAAMSVGIHAILVPKDEDWSGALNEYLTRH